MPAKKPVQNEAMTELLKESGRSNPHALPILKKVSVHVGIGSMVTGGNKDFSHVEKNLLDVTGQKPVVRKARMAISNFKLRKGLPVGIHVTLRGNRMNDFIGRLVNIALPRVRDFRGISVRGFDGHGNFALGLEDCTIFPEVNQENMTRGHGMQINVCTTARSNREAYLFLKSLGFPFRDEINVEGKVARKAQ
ncbi:50S ribosomal protein L5 [Candidatus Peregrinibacteria bacterium]|nr:MAG: 50S ribosomal protein L5 [Candidatus Peregrinibacteria bacterium]